MKKIFFAVIITIMMFCILPINVSAENSSLKAPSVRYKLVDHDKIKLSWNKVDGADGYYIYRTDVDTGRTVKYKKLAADTVFAAGGLKADTDYIFRVAAVSGDDIGNKSADVKLTTPSEWYYKIDGYSSGRWKDIKNTVILRSHADGSHEEKFDISSFFPKFRSKMKHAYINDYRLGLYQNGRYVYFEIMNFTDLGGSGADYFLWRTDNSGENLKYIGEYKYSSCTFINDKVYSIRNDNIYSMHGDEFSWNQLEEYAENYDSLKSEYIKDIFDYMDCTIYFDISDDSEKNTFHEMKKVFGAPVTDGKYLYFTSEPLYKITDETDTIIYRSDFEGNNITEMRRIAYDKNITYGKPNRGSVVLVGCDGSNCYYYVCGEKFIIKSADKCIFYSVSLENSDSAPSKIADINIDRYNIIDFNENSIYITTYEYFPKEINYDSYEYILASDYLSDEELVSMFGYEHKTVYYRIDLHSHDIIKSLEPFEWYY